VIAALATAAGVLGVIAATLFYDRRRDAKLADVVHRLREIFSEVREYRAATQEEAATKAVEAIAGLRLLGSLACGRDGTLSVSHCFVDEAGTIVAQRLGDVLYLFSTTGETFFETERLALGTPRTAPSTNRASFPMTMTDDELFATHRKRVADATAPLVVIASIEQLAALFTDQTHRNARWRAAQDPDELLETDLRRMLRGAYEWRGEGVKAQLGRGLPRARVMRS